MTKSKKSKNKKDVAAFEELARKVADTAAGRSKWKSTEEELKAEAEHSVSALVEDALEAGAALFVDTEPVVARTLPFGEESEEKPKKKSRKKKAELTADALTTEVSAKEIQPAETSEVQPDSDLADMSDVPEMDVAAQSDEWADDKADELLSEKPLGAAEGVLDSDGLLADEAETSEEESVADEPTEEDLRKYEFFVENDRLISVIESLLFSTDKAVSISSIRGLFRGSNVRTSKQIQKALDTLASRYADPMSGITLEEIGGGYQLRTKVDNAEYLKKIIKVRPFKLSGPALEVMSIIAYKQPIPKAEIDQIRGVESGHLLRALMERGLVAFEGKSEDLPGKPMLYGSTRKFLEIFGLRNIRELPSVAEVEELLPEGIGQEEKPKEKLSDITGDLSAEIRSNYSEGEDELLDIANELTTINTKSEFFEQEKLRQKEQRDRERAQDIREKLLVGEAVDEKEARWLTRYEAAQLAPRSDASFPVAEGATPTDGDGLEVEAVVDPGSETAVADLEATEPDIEIDHFEEEAPEHDSSEDLAANPTYKDEREPEADV